MPPSDSDLFHALLLEYSQQVDPASRTALEQRIHARFGAAKAVLVLDMSGFSSLTDRYGIVHYLSMVHRMQQTARPIIHAFSGVILKFEADNAFAMFPDVHEAVSAALQLNAAFATANDDTPDELDIRIACGIDFGEILVVDERDFFGDAVNRASKLGEDLAQPGEILITRQAAERLTPAQREVLHVDPLELSVSGLRIEAASIRAQGC